MDGYTEINEKLIKRHVMEKIKLELVYEFLILDSKEMEFFKVEDVNIIKDDVYIKWFDETLSELNDKIKFHLKRNKDKVYIDK